MRTNLGFDVGDALVDQALDETPQLLVAICTGSLQRNMNWKVVVLCDELLDGTARGSPSSLQPFFRRFSQEGAPRHIARHASDTPSLIKSLSLIGLDWREI